MADTKTMQKPKVIKIREIKPIYVFFKICFSISAPMTRPTPIKKDIPDISLERQMRIQAEEELLDRVQSEMKQTIKKLLEYLDLKKYMILITESTA